MVMTPFPSFIACAFLTLVTSTSSMSCDSAPPQKSAPTVQSWDDVTPEYERRVEPFTLTFVGDMLQPLKPIAATKGHRSSSLLEIGCGTGGGALLASSLGFSSVTATDVSSFMVDRTRRRVAESGDRGKGIECVACDGQRLPPEWNCRFDVAIAAFSVIFFPDPLRGLQEMWRCLKPSGRVAMAAWGDKSETPAFQIFGDAASQVVPDLASKGKPKRITGSRDSLAVLLKDAGFTDVEVVGPVTHTLRVDSPEEYYLRFALTSPPNIDMISKMDAETAMRFKEKVEELAKIRGGQPDGSVAIISSAYIAYGSKPSST